MAIKLAFVLFPNLTQLDFTGAVQVLSRIPGAETHVAAKTLAPVPTDCGFSIVPTTDFLTCPQADLICVPGGHGVEQALEDEDTIAFVAQQATAAKYASSVCTGALLLGAAGLLNGKKATTHWAYTSLLPLFGARHEDARVVRDGALITAGGVTAGIDFGFTVVAEIAGEAVARNIQLGLEYDPKPPFENGSPKIASPASVIKVSAGFENRVNILKSIIEKL